MDQKKILTNLLLNSSFLIFIFFTLLLNIKYSILVQYPNYGTNSIVLDYFIKFWGNTQIPDMNDYYQVTLLDVIRIFIFILIGVIFSISSFISLPDTYFYFVFNRTNKLYKFCMHHSYKILLKAVLYGVFWIICSSIYTYFSTTIENTHLFLNFKTLKILSLHTFLIIFFIFNIGCLCLIIRVILSKLAAFIAAVLTTLMSIYLDLKIESVNIILLDYNTYFFESFIIQLIFLIIYFFVFLNIYKIYSLRG